MSLKRSFIDGPTERLAKNPIVLNENSRPAACPRRGGQFSANPHSLVRGRLRSTVLDVRIPPATVRTGSSHQSKFWTKIDRSRVNSTITILMPRSLPLKSNSTRATADEGERPESAGVGGALPRREKRDFISKTIRPTRRVRIRRGSRKSDIDPGPARRLWARVGGSDTPPSLPYFHL